MNLSRYWWTFLMGIGTVVNAGVLVTADAPVLAVVSLMACGVALGLVVGTEVKP